MSALRVGLIGAGDISKFHLAAWRVVEGAEVIAICDLDVARARARAQEFGVEGVYEDPARMLADLGLDAVDVATWRSTHPPLIRQAAALGVHVLCQKPLADTYDEALAVAGEVDGRVRVMVNENRRFGPEYRTIRSWIDQGRLGTVNQVFVTGFRSSMILGEDGTRPAVERAVHYARERRLMVAGALTHQLDVLRYLLGPLSLLAAATLHTEEGIPGETVATLMLCTETGVPVVVGGNAVAAGFGDTPSAQNAGRSSGEPKGSPGDRLELLGTAASVRLERDVLDLIGRGPERLALDPVRGYQACFDGAVEHFVRSLETGAEFETSVADNLATLRLVEDAYAFAATRDRNAS